MAAIKGKGTRKHIEGVLARRLDLLLRLHQFVVANGFGTVTRIFLTIEHGDGAMVNDSQCWKHRGGSHESLQAVRASGLAAIKGRREDAR